MKIAISIIKHYTSIVTSKIVQNNVFLIGTLARFAKLKLWFCGNQQKYNNYIVQTLSVISIKTKRKKYEIINPNCDK